jgi:hypothetical protein
MAVYVRTTFYNFLLSSEERIPRKPEPDRRCKCGFAEISGTHENQ